MRLIFLILAAAIAVASCGKSGSTPSASTAPAPTGPRIVSTVPAATLNLLLIGAGDKLVGVTPYDKVFLPEDKQNLPVVGDYDPANLNYEVLVTLKPTVVLVQMAEPRIPARLKNLSESHHFEIINVRLENSDDLWTLAKTLGRASGHETAAERAVEKARQELQDIAAELKDKKRPRVVYVAYQGPMLVGGETILNEMITMAGGQNAGAEVGKSFPVVNMEILSKLNPDVILVGAPDQPPQRENDPRLEPYRRLEVAAVRHNRLFLVTDGEIHMASLNLPRHIRMLAALIHKNAPAAPETKP